MKKKTVLLLLLLLLSALLVLPAAAADYTLSVSSPTTAVGNEFLLRIRLPDGTWASAAELELGYDSTALEFLGVYGGLGNPTAEASGNSLIIRDSGEFGAFALRLRFKALKAGRTSVNLAEATLRDGMGQNVDVTLQSGSVNVLEHGDEATLFSLTTVPDTLSPAFSPDVTHYELAVPNGTDGVQVASQPTGYYATAFVEGHWPLKEGHNLVTIDVTSGGGVSALYTIDVFRQTSGLPAAAPTAIPGAEPVTIPTAELPTESAEEPTPAPTVKPAPTPTPTPEPQIVVQDSDETMAKLAGLRVELEQSQRDCAEAEKTAKLAVIVCSVEFFLIILLVMYIWRSILGSRSGEDEDDEYEDDEDEDDDEDDEDDEDD